MHCAAERCVVFHCPDVLALFELTVSLLCRRPDAAAANPDAARQLNAFVPEVLSKFAVELNFRLIYISTDCKLQPTSLVFCLRGTFLTRNRASLRRCIRRHQASLQAGGQAQPAQLLWRDQGSRGDCRPRSCARQGSHPTRSHPVRVFCPISCPSSDLTWTAFCFRLQLRKDRVQL